MDWSKIRKKLETEYLAESLRGRLTYFVTCYHATHDGDEGRAAIRLDGAEILKSNYYERMGAMWTHYYAAPEEHDFMLRSSSLAALHDGEFYQKDFYRAFMNLTVRALRRACNLKMHSSGCLHCLTGAPENARSKNCAAQSVICRNGCK